MFRADALVAAHKRVFHASFCTLGTGAWLQDHVARHNLNRLTVLFCSGHFKACKSCLPLYLPCFLSRARSGIATLGWLSALLCALLLWCSALCWSFCPLELLHSCYGSCFLFSQGWLSSKNLRKLIEKYSVRFPPLHNFHSREACLLGEYSRRTSQKQKRPPKRENTTSNSNTATTPTHRHWNTKTFLLGAYSVRGI